MNTGHSQRIIALLSLATFWPGLLSADVMTVQNLRDLIDSGPQGESTAMSYVQGAVEGMAALDFVHQKEQQTTTEFCRLSGPDAGENPVKHPAHRTSELVSLWEKYEYPMDDPAVEMVLYYLTNMYGCDDN